MKKTACCLLFTAYGFLLSGHAQTVVLQVDRARDSVISEWGPNKNTYMSVTLGGGFVIGSNEAGAAIKYGSSGDFFFGISTKYKISPVFSAGWEVVFRPQYYKLDQEAGKTLPDSIRHSVERYDITSLGISYFNRFNFDPNRGNFLGTYLDLGINGSWLSGFQHLTKDDLPDGSRLRTQQTSLPYDNNFGCEVFARLGHSHVAMSFRYRHTDYFKPSYNYPELPRMSLGLEFFIAP